MNKLNLSRKDSKTIQEQGLIAYKILKDILKLPEYDYNTVKESLKPIIDWYIEEYKQAPDDSSLYEYVIDNNLRSELLWRYLPPKDDLFALVDDAKNVFEEIENCERDSDVEDEFEFTTTDDYECEEEEEWQDNNDNENVEYAIPIKWADEVKTKSHTVKALAKLYSESIKYKKWLKETDDNQIFTEYYYWQERAEILNIDDILNEIKSKVKKRKKIITDISMTAEDLKKKIEKDFLKMFYRYYLNHKNDTDYSAFIDRYILINNNKDFAAENVILYKKIKK